MNKTVNKFVKNLNRRRFTNNTQRVLYTLLTANNEWVSKSAFRVPSVGARLRDLRKPQFGGFDVRCVPASDLGMNGRTFYYQLPQKSVTIGKLSKVFEGVI
jgi:hypothetical protein